MVPSVDAWCRPVHGVFNAVDPVLLTIGPSIGRLAEVLWRRSPDGEPGFALRSLNLSTSNALGTTMVYLAAEYAIALGARYDVPIDVHTRATGPSAQAIASG